MSNSSAKPTPSTGLSTEDLYWVAGVIVAWSQPGIGSRSVSKTVDKWAGRDPRECLGEIEGMPLHWRTELDRYAEKLATLKFDWQIVKRTDAAYPEQLNMLSSPPACLFLRGDASLLDRVSFSVVGTRNPSDEGVRRAKRLARVLVERGIVVTSGLAAGIDTAALEEALAYKGKAIAVIGTPLDKVYPKENAQLQQQIADTGLVVSQYPFFVPTNRGNFPERNRTMASISKATCVVEAGATSGTRHQVEWSFKVDRPVFFMRSLAENNPPDWIREAVLRGAQVLSTPEELDVYQAKAIDK